MCDLRALLSPGEPFLQSWRLTSWKPLGRSRIDLLLRLLHWKPHQRSRARKWAEVRWSIVSQVISFMRLDLFRSAPCSARGLVVEHTLLLAGISRHTRGGSFRAPIVPHNVCVVFSLRCPCKARPTKISSSRCDLSHSHAQE